MVITIADEELENLILYGRSGGRLYRKLAKSKQFMADLGKVIDIMRNAAEVGELARFGSLHYERLKYDYSGKSSVRVGYRTKYRLIFTETADGVEVELLEINEHYGKA